MIPAGYAKVYFLPGRTDAADTYTVTYSRGGANVSHRLFR